MTDEEIVEADWTYSADERFLEICYGRLNQPFDKALLRAEHDIVVDSARERIRLKKIRLWQACSTCGATVPCNCWLDHEGEWHAPEDYSIEQYLRELNNGDSI